MSGVQTLAVTLSLALAGAMVSSTTYGQSSSTPRHARSAESMAGKITGRAHADIAGEGVSGSAEFIERTFESGGTELEVTVTAKGLKPGRHGVHLHATGKCEPPAFTAAGGHFDPGPAGNTDPDANHPFHMGDIPNLDVAANGTGTLHARTTRATLSDGPLTLFDTDGSAIIIHANQDQGITGEPKSGVSGGPRVACGVIQKQ
jgi:superoxide dismutase, Cu-Zn family